MRTQAKITATDGAELCFEDRGAGEPLLLLHGLTGTGGDWSHVFDLATLAERFRIVAPDARGHGRSTDPKGAFTFRRCALDVLELMDHLGVERASAIGMSLGAKTLLHVATQAKKRISAMVLVSPAPRLPEPTRAIFRTAGAAPHTPDEWAAMRRQHVHGDAQIAALWQLPARLAEDPDDLHFSADHLRKITARTLIIAGDCDPLYPVELADELHRGIPGSSLWTVPGGGHGPIFEERRAAFVERALAFLKEV